MQNNKIIDEKVLSLLKKIEIPKNPFAFYLNLEKIEKDLSIWVRDYFYKAINEFLYHWENTKTDNKHHFLLKVYYYTWFTEKLALEINNLLNSLKYLYISFYLECANEFDPNIKLKVIIFNKYKDNIKKVENLFNKIQDSFEVMDILQDNNISKSYNKDDTIIFREFEKNFYALDDKKDKNIIKLLYNNIDIDVVKYPLSYEKTHQDYKTYKEKWGEKYKYYKAINVCFDKIVNKYNKNQVFHKNNLIYRIISNIEHIRKNRYIKQMVEGWKESFSKWKNIYKEKQDNKFFKYEYEFNKFLITYLINTKNTKLKKLFYWETTKERLSEDNWANIWWANVFYLQKIDKNIWNFEMLIFFKQFKDMIINLNNSLSWPFIKPYFYYIIIFKSLKLPLKDWQKLLFLLMFFSAESYQEYVILQDIMKSIENIWLWKINVHKSKILFYIKRFFMFFKEFSSSIILSILLVIWFYELWLINILMLWIIFLIMIINWLRYIFFPGKFEILRTFVMISIAILWYVWFTTIFPKITQPKYISYLWWTINALVNLDFSWTKEKYNDMIQFVYGKNYKKYEHDMIAWLFNRVWHFTNTVKNNKNIEQITKVTKNIIETAITQKVPDVYIKMKKWTYLKYYINKEINKFNINFKKKQELSKKVVKEYIQWYCFLHKDIYCTNKLEKLPVGFKLNLTKIREFIKHNL